MEKRFEIPFLVDCYGSLLTDNQKEILELYYESDLSLGEIAENRGKSRQAVHDLLKRSEKLLYDYESKLHYLKKELKAREIKGQIEKILNDKDVDKNKVNECLNDVLEFFNEIY